MLYLSFNETLNKPRIKHILFVHASFELFTFYLTATSQQFARSYSLLHLSMSNEVVNYFFKLKTGTDDLFVCTCGKTRKQDRKRVHGNLMEPITYKKYAMRIFQFYHQHQPGVLNIVLQYYCET